MYIYLHIYIVCVCQCILFKNERFALVRSSQRMVCHSQGLCLGLQAFVIVTEDASVFTGLKFLTLSHKSGAEKVAEGWVWVKPEHQYLLQLSCCPPTMHTSNKHSSYSQLLDETLQLLNISLSIKILFSLKNINRWLSGFDKEWNSISAP